MSGYAIGDRICHADHGLGTVGWIGTNYIGVNFDLHGKAMLKREVADMRLATEADEQELTTQDVMADGAASAEPFLVREAGEGTHSMGSHWQPFFDDANQVLLRLPEILKAARAHGGYSQFYPPPSRANEDLPRGALLLASSEAISDVMGFDNKPHRWDDQTPWRSPGGALAETPERAQGASARDSGVAAVLRLATTAADEANMVCSLFPYCFHGIEQTVVLDRIHVWESGLEAQVEGRIGAACIAFYDIDFVNNRDWYERDRSCQFVLVGLAYRVAPAQTHRFTIPRTPEYFNGMAWLTGGDPAAGVEVANGEESFDTEGMNMLLPVDEWDIDDYAFQGPIKEVWGMSMLGLRAWRLRVTMICTAPDDVDLDVVVTERTWAGDAPPRVGHSIEGRMWIQGRLWNVSRADPAIPVSLHGA